MHQTLVCVICQNQKIEAANFQFVESLLSFLLIYCMQGILLAISFAAIIAAMVQ